MSGLPDIDAEDWEKNTEYSGYDEDSDIIKVRCSLIFSIFVIMIKCVLSFFSGSGSLFMPLIGKSWQFCSSLPQEGQ